MDTKTLSAETAFKRCGQLIQQHKLDDAEHLLTQMVQQQPNRPTVLRLMSRLRAEQQRPDESVSFLNKAINCAPTKAVKGQLIQEMGYRYVKTQQFDKATSAFQQAISHDYQLAVNHHNIAVIQRTLGELEKAEKLFRQNIQRYPECTLSYSALCSLRTFPADDPLFDQLHQQLENHELSTVQKSPLYFALGKLYSGIAEHEAAFHHFNMGNRCQNKSFDWRENQAFLNEVQKAYDQDRELLCSSSTAQPIFIVGMPRSGTSLTEQIVASHPTIFGAGESLLLHNTYKEAATITESSTYSEQAARLSESQLNRLGETFLRDLAKLNQQKPGTRYIVEKTPTNFVHIGLIFQLFPNAKIIHTSRAPLDTCLSCYFTNFADRQEWSFNLINLARVYQDYSSLMVFWQQRYPGKILNIDYEQLVTDQEKQTRRVLDFVEVDWDPACLDFHQTSRPVLTASAVQVRQPINAKSLGRWKPYARQLKPVADILGIDISAEIDAQASTQA